MIPQVDSFFHADTWTWTHVVSDPSTRQAAIIDSVLDFDLASGQVSTASARKLLQHIREHDLSVAWIMETHAHADHLSAADWLKRQLAEDGEAPRTAIGAGIVGVQRHFRDVFGLGAEFAAVGAEFDRLLEDGERVRIGELELTVIGTPGHTNESVSYLVGDAVFVGDTLFAPESGTGRCDFPGGDATAQYRSIRRLFELPDTTRVFLCHDYPAAGALPQAQTTIAEEKARNLQLNSATPEAEYVAFRRSRDASLAVPRLLYPSVQVNIRAGRLPPADAAGRIFMRLPIRADA